MKRSNGDNNSGDTNDPPTPISAANSRTTVDDVERELEQSIVKQAITTEDRFRLLDARDKLLRFRNPRVKVRVEEATKLSGTCTDMCPEKERYMREVQRRLNPYECKAEQDSEVDHCLAIKEYSRSSADQEEPLSHELRPISVLHATFNYLLHNIIPGVEEESENLENWYFFLWDRTRAIRKDITQQQLCDLDAVRLMEKCARFHIVCSSLLCELDRHAFDPKLNGENLMKCLQSLEHMYTDLTLKGVRCPNEPEFRAYQILMNLNEGDALWEIQQRPKWILKSPDVALALKIYLAVCDNNSMGFFRLVKRSSFLMSCILHGYFFQVRARAIRAIVKAHTRPFKEVISMPKAIVQNILGFGFSSQGTLAFEEFCSSFGIEASETDESSLEVQRSSKRSPEAPIIIRDYDLIESKLTTSVSEVINGETLGPNPLDTYEPFTSFDKNGFLKEYILKSLMNTRTKSAISTSATMATVDATDWEPRSSSPAPSGTKLTTSSSSAPTKPAFKNTFQRVFGAGTVLQPSTTSAGLFTNSSSMSTSPKSFTIASTTATPSSFMKPSAFNSFSSTTTGSVTSNSSLTFNVPKQSFGISTETSPSPSASGMDSAKPIFGGSAPITTPELKTNLFNASSPFQLPSQKASGISSGSSAPVFNPFGTSTGLNTFTAPQGASGQNTFGSVAGTPNVNSFGMKPSTLTGPGPGSSISTTPSGLPLPNIFTTSQSQSQQPFQSRPFSSSTSQAQLDPRRKRRISSSDDSHNQALKRTEREPQAPMFVAQPLPPNLPFAPLNFAPKPVPLPPSSATSPISIWPPGTKTQVSSSLVQKIEQEVVKDLTKSIAARELERHKKISGTVQGLANFILQTVMEEQVQIIAGQSIADRKMQVETAVSKASKTIQRLKLRTLFINWKEVAMAKQQERTLRLQKQKENLESFPPIVAMPLSPATILSTWCGFRKSAPSRSSFSRPGSSKSFSLGSNGSSGSENSLSTNEAEQDETGSFSEDHQDFPPIVSMQLSPEAILSTWCGINPQNIRKRTRSPEHRTQISGLNTSKRPSITNIKPQNMNMNVDSTTNSNPNSKSSFLQEIRDLLNQVRQEKDLTQSTLLSNEENIFEND